MRALVAEFERETDVNAALSTALDRELGFIEAYGPYPLQEAAKLQNLETWIVPAITLIAAVTGAAGTYWLQYWTNAIDYPLNVGGRPLHSWPAFIPASMIVGVLSGGGATLLGMLFLCRLPTLHHPIFEAQNFERASQDRFFLSIEVGKSEGDEARVRAFLQSTNPLSISEVAE